MPEPMQILTLIPGPIVLGVLIWRGLLRADALADGPVRRVGLRPPDLLVGLGLMILGPAVMVMLFPAQDESEMDAMGFASRVLMGQAVGQLIPVLYLLVRASAAAGGLRLIGAVPTKPGRDLVWGVLGFVAAVPMIYAVMQASVLVGGLFGYEPDELAHRMLTVLVDSDDMPAKALIVLSAVVVAPILEEGIFRGLVQSAMIETVGEGRRWAVVLISAFVFTVIHDWQHWHTLPGLFVLGLVLGWLYERSGSLWPGIVVHMLFNAMNVTLALLMAPQGA